MSASDKFNAELRDWFHRQRLAPGLTVAFYAFCALSLNFALLETLVVGRVPHNFPEIPSISEATVYWGYVGVLSILTFAVDVTIFRFLLRVRKKAAKKV